MVVDGTIGSDGVVCIVFLDGFCTGTRSWPNALAFICLKVQGTIGSVFTTRFGCMHKGDKGLEEGEGLA